MKFGGEFALFPLENQRYATRFWKSLFHPERACCGERFLRRQNDGRDGQGGSRRGVLSRLRGSVAPGPQPLRASRTRLALFGTGRSSPPGDAKVFLRTTRLPEADIWRAFRGNRASGAGASNVAAGTYRPPFRLGSDASLLPTCPSRSPRSSSVVRFCLSAFDPTTCAGRVARVGASARQLSARRLQLWSQEKRYPRGLIVKRRPKLTLDRRPKLTHRFRGADGSVRPGGAGWGCAAGASAVR